MLQINREELDQAIEGLEGMFQATEKVLADYEAEKEVIEKRSQDLADRMSDLQQKHIEIMLKRESIGDTTEYIKLSKELTSTSEEMGLIESLQEQLKDDFKELKQKHLPIIRDAYSKDLSVKSEFNVDELVAHVKYELVKSISDYAKEIKNQQAPLLPAIGGFLEDSELMDNNKGFRRLFEFDRTNLAFSEINKTVLHRNHITLACSGTVSSEIRKPKVKQVDPA